MDLSSKDYDRIRAARRKAGARGAAAAGGGAGSRRTADTAVMGRACGWKGCHESGEYRAPKGRGQEGEYHWFCLDHVREYNKGYNYFQGMSDDDVIAYQRDAITGHRPTRPMGVGRAERANRHWNVGYDDPLGLFGDFTEAETPRRRSPKGPERAAFEVMGLPDNASREAIKSRYKTLVKRHHPDANHGDRSSEDRLRSIINAYNVLRRAGYC